jgi:hypothetical protein
LRNEEIISCGNEIISGVMRSSLAARDSVVSLSLSKGGASWRAVDPWVRCRNLGVVLSDVEARLPQSGV